MRILLVNPGHPSIGSRIPDDHLPPLGLLSVGGPLIDDGHHVKLLDAEFGPMPVADIVTEAEAFAPDALLVGHSGSTSGHPGAVEIFRAIRQALPACKIVYGGVFPTYHWRDVLAEVPEVDVIVRGEGEETARRLMRALESGRALMEVAGIAYRMGGRPFATLAAPAIRDLDAYRIGWELIDF
ncbi:MAG TPA: cobalamin-dependent protein, partial [Dongiaceae bacterium]|nr:cobalamin-dependent protein [Dongiaceae bacterium]